MSLAAAFANAWRDFNTDGDPSSGLYKPVKATIRALGALIDAIGLRISSSNVAGGDAALDSYVGDFSTGLGRSAGEKASGDRNVFLGALAGRYHVGSSVYTFGFASFQNVKGDRHIGIGDHSGSPPYTERPLANPSMNATTNVLTTDPPTFYGAPITGLEVGQTYRLQFENGAGTAPLPLASVSTLATLQSIGATYTWLVTSYDVTTAGSAGYVVGLCWYWWDDEIVVGSGSPDGPNQCWLGFENTREVLPNNNGLTSYGRATFEAATYGERGRYLLRNVTSRMFTVESFSGEAPVVRYDVAGVRRATTSVAPSNGNFQIVVYDGSGVGTATPLEIDNARGTVRPRVIVNAVDDAAAATAGVPVGEVYRNGSVLMIRVA